MTVPLPHSVLTNIIAISADAIICIDRDQRITFFNEGAAEIFGYARDEVLGKPLDMLLPEGARNVHRRHVEHFAESPIRARRMGERQVIAGRRKNGEEFPAEAAIAKLEHGADIVFSVVLRDVTERRRAEARLQRAVAARDDMLSVVSHDLRNPVTAVKMLSGVLLRRKPRKALPPDVGEQLGLIREAARQMDTLIQDLLDVTQAEAGRFTVDAQRVACAPLLRDALRTIAPLAQDKRIRIQTRWSRSLPKVYVDPDRIAQVVSNVVGNAIKFAPQGGRVTVSAARKDDQVLVSVADNGPGMPAEHLEHVFDRFWQASRRNRGAGLGLPIAKAIVEAHGGRIWAESKLGAGATFHFTLNVRLRSGQAGDS